MCQLNNFEGAQFIQTEDHGCKNGAGWGIQPCGFVKTCKFKGV